MLGQALAQEFATDNLIAWDRADLDITNREQVQEKIGALRPTSAKATAGKQANDFVIINAAAYTAVDDAEKNRAVAFTVNAEAVGSIAAAARELRVPLVHYSTDYVFAGDQADGYGEDDQPGPPVNAYGESKLAGEQALRESGAQFYLVRTAWLYGAGGKNFVDTILRLGKEKPELRVIHDQHGSPTYTRDVAAATRTLIAEYEPNVYHVTNSGLTTWYEFAVKIFELTQNSVPVIPITSPEYPTPAKRPAWSWLRNSRGPALRPWQEALQGYLQERSTI
jgi:dTDP-4-dehydrorhamnose reductase